MRRAWAFLLAASLAPSLAPSPLAAQSAPPSTDIWVAPIAATHDSIRLGAPVDVTARPGYDNQPAFSANGRAILYTSVRDDGQADIWRYDRDRRTTTRLTATAESEYSPTLMPGGRRMSVVRVEADSTQRLWSFTLDGRDPRLVVAGIKPVGYHAWLDDSTLALFVLGSPNSLQVANVRTGTATVVAHDIGRSLLRVPGRHAVSFLQHGADSAWYLTILDLDRHRGDDWPTERVATMLPGSDYLVWLPDGRAIAGAGSKLYALDPRHGATWREFADLAPAGLSQISRLALSPDARSLAIVAEPK